MLPPPRFCRLLNGAALVATGGRHVDVAQRVDIRRADEQVDPPFGTLLKVAFRRVPKSARPAVPLPPIGRMKPDSEPGRICAGVF